LYGTYQPVSFQQDPAFADVASDEASRARASAAPVIALKVMFWFSFGFQNSKYG
jgi:hypothetical protein